MVYGIKVNVFVCDIGIVEVVQFFYYDVVVVGYEIGILINNVGFGGWGDYIVWDLVSEQVMVDLNVMFLMMFM